MTQVSTTQSQARPDVLSRPLLSIVDIDWEKAIYVTFIIVALVTRFWDLGSRVVSHDESLHTQFSYQFYIGDGYSHTPLMHGPSLFHFTALAYWLFGDSDFSSRVPVALIGVLLVMLPYFLRDWIGRTGALFASFLLLISPYITYYSRYIRHDIYVIAFAVIVFIAILYYLREPKDKYLWWFALGLALMFTTMETAFIYVAIFGSFLVLRLAHRLWQAPWFHEMLPDLRQPMLMVAIAVVLIGGGFTGQQLIPGMINDRIATPVAPPGEGFAADPEADADRVAATAPAETGETIMRWIQIAGVVLLSAGLFLAVTNMRPHIDAFAEFDIVVLFTTLVLPLASPILVNMAGWDPLDYSIQSCEAIDPSNVLACWLVFLSSGLVRTGIFLMTTLVVAALVGLWWDRRRWLIAAAIFHGLFIVLFTSAFTNPGGWSSGMVGSLGYWLEQHDVQRGNQPYFYYFFVTPFYEFLPLIFALAAVRLWLRQHRLNKITGYWLTLLLASFLVYSLSNWWYRERFAFEATAATTFPLGLILGSIVLLAGLLYWFLSYRQQLLAEYDLNRNWQGLFDSRALFGLVPFLAWWLLLTWVIYSIAGEKMPWLSTHFIFPMVLLAGWFFNEKLAPVDTQRLLSRHGPAFIALVMIFIVAVFLALGPIFLGQIQLDNQLLTNLSGIGRFFGSVVVAVGLYYGLQLTGQQLERPIRRRAWLLGIFGLLSLLTMRFTYMANFPNADYVTEFAVYAHGAPATKSVVMAQIEDLSMRLHGDKSLRVAYDNDSSWPFTWYLREYPNRVYFGENPSRSIAESPVVIVGSRNWSTAEPFLGNEFDYRTYTFLWWPAEEYRKFSWNAILGDPKAPGEERRGLWNPRVRQALWDIFFYRDYTKYGQVFGGTYTAGQWPLRHDLRLYIRRDVLANLWDYGINATAAEPPRDPYAENEFELMPSVVLGTAGTGSAPGQLLAPRNVAVGANGEIFVADSGNHRIQVFDANGQFRRAWGNFGAAPGEFNEPWGLAVDESHVYVADTWNHRIQKFTLDGQLVTVFGQSGTRIDGQVDGGLFFGPRDVLILPDGRLLVTDTGNHRLQIFDQDGNFLEQIGGPGVQLGQFNEPVAVALAPDETTYLTDTWNGRIQRFWPGMLPLQQWPVDAWKSETTNNKPYLAVDSAGRVYTTDPEGFRILIFSSEGDYLARFGRYGLDVASLGLPNGIAIDGQDNIYVADAHNNRVLRYDPIFGPPEGFFPAEPLDPGAGFTDEAEEPSESEIDAEPTETAPEEDGTE